LAAGRDDRLGSFAAGYVLITALIGPIAASMSDRVAALLPRRLIPGTDGPTAATPLDMDIGTAALYQLGTDLLQIRVLPGSRLHGMYVPELRLLPGSTLGLVARNGATTAPNPSTRFQTRTHRPGRFSSARTGRRHRPTSTPYWGKMDQVRIALLGSLEVSDAGGAVHVAGARLRTLLIALALTPGRLVPTARLIDAIWGDNPPAGAANALQALVSRLRRTLPEAVIESHLAGYRLVIDQEAVDVIRFERLVRAGRAALSEDPASAAERLREALGLWRGPALLDVLRRSPFRHKWPGWKNYGWPQRRTGSRLTCGSAVVPS
jgi:Bacterial transcriptional activator domain/Transcriptional regulatory protein, C terminal